VDTVGSASLASEHAPLARDLPRLIVAGEVAYLGSPEHQEHSDRVLSDVYGIAA